MQGIYRIDYNGKCAYVGSAIDIRRRFNQHRDTLRRGVHRNFILQRIWNKHSDEFEFSVVAEVEKTEDLMGAEQLYIDTIEPICNLAKANGSHPHTEEAKEKMRGRIVSAETREKLSIAHKGKPSPLKGIKTGRVPKSAFKKGMIPANKKYSAEELVEMKRQWSREAAARYRVRHADMLREYKRVKAQEYRLRKKELLNASK